MHPYTLKPLSFFLSFFLSLFLSLCLSVCLFQVNSYPEFVTCSANASLADLVDHIDYIVNLTGSAQHVGFGLDLDGISILAQGLEDVSRYPELVAELIRRGYSDADVTLIMGGNLIRVMRANEDMAKAIALDTIAEGQIFPNVSCRSDF